MVVMIIKYGLNANLWKYIVILLHYFNLSGLRNYSFVTLFCFFKAEAALRFDDDDDDDEDDEDIQIPRSSRRLRKRARISSSTTSSGTKHTSSKVNSSDGKGRTPVIPEIDLITTQVVPKLTTANVADLVLLR